VRTRDRQRRRPPAVILGPESARQRTSDNPHYPTPGAGERSPRSFVRAVVSVVSVAQRPLVVVPGNNYVTDLAALPVNSLTNATALCPDAACAGARPITSVNQLRVPAGALGNFFGPGTTVGIPFAAQLGIRVRF
jgi:hypothetical protein